MTTKYIVLKQEEWEEAKKEAPIALGMGEFNAALTPADKGQILRHLERILAPYAEDHSITAAADVLEFLGIDVKEILPAVSRLNGDMTAIDTQMDAIIEAWVARTC